MRRTANTQRKNCGGCDRRQHGATPKNNNLNKNEKNQKPNTVSPTPKAQHQEPKTKSPDGGSDGSNTTTAAASSASAFDHLIPHIRVPKEKYLIELFQYKELEKILGRPTYKKLLWLRKQLLLILHLQ